MAAPRSRCPLALAIVSRCCAPRTLHIGEVSTPEERGPAGTSLPRLAARSVRVGRSRRSLRRASTRVRQLCRSCAGRERWRCWPTSGTTLVGDHAVDQLAQDLDMARMSRGLLDHVDQPPSATTRPVRTRRRRSPRGRARRSPDPRRRGRAHRRQGSRGSSSRTSGAGRRRDRCRRTAAAPSRVQTFDRTGVL